MPDETTHSGVFGPKFLVSGLALIAAALIALQFPGLARDKLDLVPNMTETAASVIGGLAALALILERALAVIIDLLYGEERAEKQQALNAQRLTAPMVSLSSASASPAAVDAHAEARKTLARPLAELAQVDAKRERFRLLVGFALAFLISAAGVRTISELVTDPTAVKDWAVTFDIMLTAGLLAGGSNGLAKLVELLQEAANRKLTNLRTT